MKQKWILSLVVLWLMASTGPTVDATPAAAPEAPLVAIPLTSGVPYTQDFDTLASSGTGSAIPDGWVFSESGTNANTTYAAGTGSATAGDTYSFGAASNSERAFGGLQSGGLIPTVGAEFQNSTGATIQSLAVSYNCEQWRLGAADRVDRMDFQYSLDAASLATGTWVDVDSLDCLTTDTTGPAGARDGNSAAYRTAVAGNVTGLSIANGSAFWIRWTDFNAAGSDDGLAADDFEVTAQTTTAITLRTLSAAPQGVAATMPVAGLALLGGLAALRRWRRT